MRFSNECAVAYQAKYHILLFHAARKSVLRVISSATLRKGEGSDDRKTALTGRV